MRKATEIFAENYQEYLKDGCFYISSYDTIIREFGDILHQVSSGSYTGDTYVLYKVDNKYGYLCFGWGSCSGCDALQACTDFDELDNLIESLYNRIQWFDSNQDALDFFNNHDWEGDYAWCDDGYKNFVRECIKILDN